MLSLALCVSVARICYLWSAQSRLRSIQARRVALSESGDTSHALNITPNRLAIPGYRASALTSLPSNFLFWGYWWSGLHRNPGSEVFSHSLPGLLSATYLVLLDRSGQPRRMNHHLFPIVYESQLLELVHEIGNTGASGSDHGSESIVRYLRHRDLLLTLFP